jgi:hypothetical protein
VKDAGLLQEHCTGSEHRVQDAMMAIVLAAPLAVATAPASFVGDCTGKNHCGCAHADECFVEGCTDMSQCCIGASTLGDACSTNYDCCMMPHCCAIAVCACDGSLCDGSDGGTPRCFRQGNCFDECTCGTQNCYPLRGWHNALVAYRAHESYVLPESDEAETRGLSNFVARSNFTLA